MHPQVQRSFDEVAARAADASPPLLKIVHLEDDLNDREFVRRSLSKAGMNCEFSYAENFQQFDAALATGNSNLILSDFTLPGYSGSEALAHARENYPDIPYIFVSGTIGEERAVESLKGGATDYVLKNNLSRLPAAVEYATRVARERLRLKKAETALRESEDRFQEMAKNIRDVFWVCSFDGCLPIYVSPGFSHIWGRSVEELQDRPGLWLDSIFETDRARVVRAFAALAAGGELRIEYRIRRPDGTVRWIETRGYPSVNRKGESHAVGVSADISERKLLQEQLLQAQKMEAVGQLAGGVAHDFNNMLTVINGYASLALSSEELPASLKRPLEQIAASGDRAANLTRQLLVFSRKQAMQIRPINLNSVIEESMRMLTRVINENIELELDLDPTLPQVEADMGMMEQVLMNLIVNARDAMPEGGKLSLSTSHRMIGPNEMRVLQRGNPGVFVCMQIKDTGEGMSDEVMQRIFEPFFTTKEAGKGTGLGLSVVFGIVENHGGWLTTESERGRGTTFTIHLPAMPGVGTPFFDTRPPEVIRGTETILLVEDEPAVRELTQTVLQNYGYRVITAGSGAEALKAWKEHPGKIHLVLSDVIMPDAMSGFELATLLRTADPSLRVICMSGYNRETAEQGGGPPENVGFIQKPCAPAELARAVRATLDGKATGEGKSATR